jgi:nickel-dependent lactate racemase
VQRASGADRVFRVPYGHEELEFMLQPWFDVDVVESGTAPPITDLPGAAVGALRRPRGSPSLAQLAREAIAARPDATAVIAVTDLTRACPDDVLVPPLLDELNAGGIPDGRITVIVAVGLHRATTDAEKREKLGRVVDRVRVVDSDGRDPAALVDLGPIPPYGVPGSTQRIVKDADLVIATGIVEPHQYAGYSGPPRRPAFLPQRRHR